jgi:hypothetical protein
LRIDHLANIAARSTIERIAIKIEVIINDSITVVILFVAYFRLWWVGGAFVLASIRLATINIGKTWQTLNHFASAVFALGGCIVEVTYPSTLGTVANIRTKIEVLIPQSIAVIILTITHAHVTIEFNVALRGSFRLRGDFTLTLRPDSINAPL